MIYRRRPDFPYSPAPVVAALRVARESMIKCKDGLRPFGPGFVAADTIVKAIDGFATLLTGDETYFSVQAHGGGSGPLGTIDDKRARERGETPWMRVGD